MSWRTEPLEVQPCLLHRTGLSTASQVNLLAGPRGSCMVQLTWRGQNKLFAFPGVLQLPPQALRDREGRRGSGQAYSSCSEA